MLSAEPCNRFGPPKRVHRSFRAVTRELRHQIGIAGSAGHLPKDEAAMELRITVEVEQGQFRFAYYHPTRMLGRPRSTYRPYYVGESWDYVVVVPFAITGGTNPLNCAMRNAPIV